MLIRKVYDKWQLVGRVEPGPEAFESEYEELRTQEVLSPKPPFTHSGRRGKFDCEPSYGRVKKGSFLDAGSSVRIGEITIDLPETGFKNPFKKEVPLYQDAPAGSLFKGLVKSIGSLRYPEVLSGKQASLVPEDPNNQFDDMYRGSANKYVCAFDRINEMHQEVYGGPIPVLDLEQLRERWGFSDLRVPNMSSSQRHKLDNHRISAAGEVGISIKVNWIAVGSIT